MVLAINPNRIAPVTEDLATPYNQLEIIRGWERMYRVDQPLASGAAFVEGEWGVLGATGLSRPTTTAVPNTYLVIAGTDRFDVAATKKATVVMNSKIIVRTTKYNAGGSYAIGTALTVKSLGAGEASVTPWTSPEPVMARVTKVGSGFLEFEVL